MKVLSLKDIYAHAMSIEEIGERFYKKLSELYRDKELKALFEKLSLDEKRHYEFFKSQKGQDGNDFKIEAYKLHLVKELSNKIFNRVRTIKKFVSFDEKIEIFDALIEVEQEVVAFFTDISKHVIFKDTNKMDFIINEEKSHIRELVELRKKFLSSSGEMNF